MNVLDGDLAGRGERSSPAPPDAAAVRDQLERVLASTDFAASERSRGFLRYVVEETLAGRADRIKAYSVATEVFGRDEGFDGQNDPVVRIEAGRLRRALERYYLLSGRDDPVVIDIPKGGYVPAFKFKPLEAGTAEPPPIAANLGPATAVELEAPAPPPKRGQFFFAAAVPVLLAVGGAAWYAAGIPPFGAADASVPAGPRIMVLPFSDLGEGTVSELYSAGLTDEIVSTLGSFKEISVFGLQTSRLVGPDPDIAELHQDLGVDYVLEGSVRSGTGQIRVSARLLDSTNGTVLWSRSYEHPLTAEDLFAIQVKTAGEVAAAIAQPYGIVFQAETTDSPRRPPNDLDAYLCTLRYYTYRAAITPDRYAAVRNCLEQAVQRFPNYATAWALLSLMYIDEIRTGFARGSEPPEARAVVAARTAVRLDPENVRALQALATALFFSHQLDEAFEVSDRALALNSNDAELLGQLGQLLGLSGRMDEGRALLEKALAQNPGHSGFYKGVLAMIAYMQHDYDTALSEIEKADMRKLPVYHGVAAIIYARKGLIERAKAELDLFEKMAPGFIPNLWAQLDLRNIPYESQLHIAEGLEKAGATIPAQPVAAKSGKTDS